MQAHLHYHVAATQGLQPIEVTLDDGEGNAWRWEWRPKGMLDVLRAVIDL